MRVFLVLFWIAALFVGGMLASALLASTRAASRLGGRQTLFWIAGLVVPGLVLHLLGQRFQEGIGRLPTEWGDPLGLARWWGAAWGAGFLIGGWPAQAWPFISRYSPSRRKRR